MTYLDKLELKKAVKTILVANEESIENICCDFSRREAMKIREMANE